VGGAEEKPKKIDVRVICSTNRNLEELKDNYKKSNSKEGFRDDLYWRINVLPITMPSLSERFRTDNELPMILFTHFLKKAFLKNKIDRIADLNLSDEAYEIISNHPWEGNLREFENKILYATALLNDNENVITGDLIKKCLKNEFKKSNEFEDYVKKLENGGTLSDIPTKNQREVLRNYIKTQFKNGNRIQTEDLIWIVLGKEKELDKKKFKNQKGSVTQILHNKGNDSISLREIGGEI
jgi:transcriptional regulator with GAF, ATPase, and Fis domain